MSKAIKFAIAILALLLLGALGVMRIFATPPDTSLQNGQTEHSAQTTMPARPSEAQIAANAFGVASSVRGDSQTAAHQAQAPAITETFTLEQFDALTAQTLRDLPTPAQMREMTAEEAHGYPEPLAKAGPMLGRIAQAVQDQPALADSAAQFYIKCATDTDILVPVRALCYSHVIKNPQAPAADTLPAEVVRLAKLIPAT